MSSPNLPLYTPEQPQPLIEQNKFTVFPFLELHPENFHKTWRSNSRVPTPFEKHVPGADKGHEFPVWFTRKRRFV